MDVDDVSISICDEDSDFDPEEAQVNDPIALVEDFVTDWINTLPRYDLYALCLLLIYLPTRFSDAHLSSFKDSGKVCKHEL